MRMNGFQRQRDLAVSFGCGAALLAATAAACSQRGFFFTGEMYVFLTLWFAWCAALAIWVFVLYARGEQAGYSLAVNWPRSGGDERAEAGEVRGGLNLKCRVWKGATMKVAGEIEFIGEPVSGGGDSRNAGSGAGLGWMAGNGLLQIGGAEREGKLRLAMLLLPGCSVIICVLYALHMQRQPVSSLGTLNELLRWGLYASFALFALLVAGTRRGKVLLATVWHLTGLVICLSALLAVCGGLPLPYAVAYSQSPEVSVTGARLAGLLEYPNTFGAVMAVFLLERLFAAASSAAASPAAASTVAGAKAASAVVCTTAAGSNSAAASSSAAAGTTPTAAAQGSPRLTAARLLPLFPYAAALLLSESRGAWLAAACAAAAALLWKRQLFAPLLLAGAAPAVGAALLYRQLARTGLAVERGPGLLLLAGLWAGALLAGLWLHRRCTGAAGRPRAAMLALAAGGWTAAGSAVLLQVSARITGPSPTAAARGLLYRDAWKLAAEAPWLGRGGETWRQSYLAAQSRPYVGSQVHSGYLDILLNLGMAGTAAVLLLLLAAGWLVGKASPRLLPPLLVIVLHSAVDFDWSYGLIWLLLLLLPAWALAESRVLAAAPQTIAVNADIPAVVIGGGAATPDDLADIPPAAVQLKLILRRIGIYTAILLVCGSAILCGRASFQAAAGAALYKQAASAGSAETQAVLLRRSLELNPRAPQTAVSLSGLLPVEQGAAVLRHSLIYSPGNAALHWELAKLYLTAGSPGEALYWVRRSLQRDGFNAAKRLAATEGMLRLGQRGLTEGDKGLAAESAAAGQELLRHYTLLAAKEHSKGPQHNDRGFGNMLQAEDMGLRLRNLVTKVHTDLE